MQTLVHCQAGGSIFVVIGNVILGPLESIKFVGNVKLMNRILFLGISNTYLGKAISIAIRYSASRKQFKEDDAVDELPVLEYPSQQYRLLPHLCTAVVQKVFTKWFTLTFTEFSKSLFTGEIVPYVGNEIHALSTAAKPVCTWAVRDAIQECREATGGHGYLKGKSISNIRPLLNINVFNVFLHDC